MATPSWSDKVTVVAMAKVSNTGSARGTLNLANLFGAYLFLRWGRLTSTAPATGIIVTVRRILRDVSNSRDIPHPGTIFTYQDTTTAANLTTLNGSPTHPNAAVTLTSATGFAGNQTVCIVDDATTPTRAEWHRTSKISGTTLTFDREMAHTGIDTADTITNQAIVIAPIWLDGTPHANDIEVIFDYGLEANASHVVVEAWAQTLTAVA